MTIFGMSLYNIAGTFGVTLIVVAYFLLQTEKIKSSNLYYSLLNGVGSLLVLYSLLYEFNFPSFIVEFFWLLISLYGLVKYLILKNKRG